MLWCVVNYGGHRALLWASIYENIIYNRAASAYDEVAKVVNNKHTEHCALMQVK